MKPKTQEYVQFIKENHKSFGGCKSGADCAKEMGVSQGRVSQLIKSMREVPSESTQTMEQAAA